MQKRKELATTTWMDIFRYCSVAPTEPCFCLLLLRESSYLPGFLLLLQMMFHGDDCWLRVLMGFHESFMDDSVDAQDKGLFLAALHTPRCDSASLCTFCSCLTRPNSISSYHYE